MQVPQDHYYYHTNLISGADWRIKNERHLLAKQQKKCKVMARKFTTETNRRRKLLAERRRQWDLQEQRLMEDILDQRRQQLQDATERFQRAHLPPSQRHRQTFRRKVVNVDEALKLIQGTLNPSFPSDGTIITSCIPVKPPIVSKSPPRQTLSAVESHTNLLKEPSKEEPKLGLIPQASQQSDCCNSDSLSCKDSLELEVDSCDTNSHQQIFSSFSINTEKETSHLHDQNYPTSDLEPYAGLILLGADASQKPTKYNQKTQDGHEWRPLSKISWGFKSFNAMPHKESQVTLHDSNFSEVISGEHQHLEMNPIPPEALCTKAEALKQHVILCDRKVNDPSPDKNCYKMLFRAPNISLNNSTIDNVLKEDSGGTSINNLNKISNFSPKTEKLMNSASRQSASLLKSHTDTHAGPEEELQASWFTDGRSHVSYEVRFIKGILKKHSNILSGETMKGYNSGGLSSPKHVALSIKDSVELTRAKAMETEGSNVIKKKLRWLDVVSVEKEAKEQNLVKAIREKSSEVIQLRSISVEQQSRATILSGSARPAASMDDHFTKQAWADVGVQVSMPQEQTDEVKVPRSSNRSAGPKVPRREPPARVGAGPVSSRTRKGTLIRPQSATEVSQIAKTQGRKIIPRPPPRVEVVEGRTAANPTPYGAAHASGSCNQARAAEQMLRRSNSSDTFFLSNAPYAVPEDRSHVAYTTLPSSFISSFSEGNLKNTLSSLPPPQNAHSRARGTALNKLACTPTDEEIAQLWHGVRSALTTNEGKTPTIGHTLESGGVNRKPCIQPLPSGSRRLTSQTTSLLRYGLAFPNEGSASSAQSHLVNVRVQSLLEAPLNSELALESVPRQKQPSQEPAITNISLEEQKILLSLHRLDHQLHRVQKHGFVFTPLNTGERKGSSFKRSANQRSPTQKKV